MNSVAPKLYTTPPQIILQDFSLSSPAETKVGEVIEAIKKHSHLVYKITLGEQPHMLKNGQKTLFLHVSFHSPKQTITNEDVEHERQKIMTFLNEEYSITLRS